MGRLTMVLAYLLAGLVIFATALWTLGPREPVVLTHFDPSKLPEDLELYLSEEEGRVPDIRPGEEKRIVWSGEKGAKTPVSLIYLHGFSAASPEISPVVEDLGKALGANIFFTRFAGHGRDGAAMGTATVGAWVEDAGEAVAIGRRLGGHVVVIGTSTGAPISVLGAEAGWPADAYVFISPNFRPKDRMSRLLTWPLARWWVPLVVGAERGFEPRSEEQGKHWTTRYDSVAVVPMAATAKAAREADVGAIGAPVLAIFRDSDEVVDEATTRKVLARWGGAVTILNPDPVEGDDPQNHVIAGAIMSPGNTAWTEDRIRDWIKELW